MNFESNEQRNLGVGLALAGSGTLIAIAPTIAPVPRRPALYTGTVLLAVGVLLALLNRPAV